MRRTLLFVAAVLLCMLLYQLGQWYFRNRREASFYRPLAELAAPYEQVLVLGSTAAAREVLRNPSVKGVDLVLTAKPLFRPEQSRLHCYTEDAFQFLETREKHYDFIIVALAAPKTETENRAFTNLFYRMSVQSLMLAGEGGETRGVFLATAQRDGLKLPEGSALKAVRSEEETALPPVGINRIKRPLLLAYLKQEKENE